MATPVGSIAFVWMSGSGTNAPLSGVDQSQVYDLTVTAVDTSGHESSYSNELIYDLSQIDLDGNGLSDWDELLVYHTDPLRADTDGDGLSDTREVTRDRTDSRQADTDGDGVTDGAEVEQGSDSTNASSVLLQHLPKIPWEQSR